MITIFCWRKTTLKPACKKFSFKVHCQVHATKCSAHFSNAKKTEVHFEGVHYSIRGVTFGNRTIETEIK